MTLYSLHGARPEPLPFRITLPSGFTRTDPSTFTEDEIHSAGFTGPYVEPLYDTATEQLDWVDGSYVINPLPPPPPIPQWVEFSAAVMTDPSVNTMLTTLLQSAPGLYGGLVVGLQQASRGDTRVFLNSWHAAHGLGVISAELITEVQQLAAAYDLPSEFVVGLSLTPTVAPLDDPV
jgi:hypothetical protein